MSSTLARRCDKDTSSYFELNTGRNTFILHLPINNLETLRISNSNLNRKKPTYTAELETPLSFLHSSITLCPRVVYNEPASRCCRRYLRDTEEFNGKSVHTRYTHRRQVSSLKSW